MSIAAVPSDRFAPIETDVRQLGKKPASKLPLLASMLVLFCADVCAFAGCLKLAILERIWFLRDVLGVREITTLSFRHYLKLEWLWALLIIFMIAEGLYTARRSLWSEMGKLIKAISLGLVAILATATLAQQGNELSRITIVLLGANLLLVMPFLRLGMKMLLREIGMWRKRILVLGTPEAAQMAVRELTKDPVLGYEIVGILTSDPESSAPCVGWQRAKPICVLGSITKAAEILDTMQIEDVLIAMPDLSEPELLGLVHQLQPCCRSIYLVPQLWALPMMSLQVDGFLRERVMMLKLSNNLANRLNAFLKRAFDIIASVCLTTLVAPLCIISAILIRLDSRGSALFLQQRIGYRGRPFRCMKFRSMSIDSDEKLHRYLNASPKAAEEWHKYAKLRTYDPRLTRIGRFLRKWSLDELPQLLNVLKGDMSMVGPRPYLLREQDRIGTDLYTIVSARPGITGLWQVSGRNALTFEERVQIEAWYVRNWTFWLDCIILMKTFGAIFCRAATPRDAELSVAQKLFSQERPAEQLD